MKCSLILAHRALVSYSKTYSQAGSGLHPAASSQPFTEPLEHVGESGSEKVSLDSLHARRHGRFLNVQLYNELRAPCETTYPHLHWG